VYGPSITVTSSTTPGSIWLKSESMSTRVLSCVIPSALALSWLEW
jgi:hypothetical protein